MRPAPVLRAIVGVVVGFGLAAGAGCGATPHQVEIGPPPARETRAVLAGGLCHGDACTCREEAGDATAGAPAGAARKRFEIRLGSPHELWLTINQATVLYKSPERATACFYVDLAPGANPIALRASNADGVSVALEIHELGTKTGSWYDTFAFSCGSPGVCAYDELTANKARYVGAKRQMYDRCGTTRVTGVSWDHGKAPDQEHPSELVVRATLEIYKGAADKPRGDATCGTRAGRRGADDPPPEGDAP
jgi:hypothetical protein